MTPIQQFWHYLYLLVNDHTYQCVVTPSGYTEPQYAPILFGGSCIQSFVMALVSHGLDSFYYLTWSVLQYAR